MDRMKAYYTYTPPSRRRELNCFCIIHFSGFREEFAAVITGCLRTGGKTCDWSKAVYRQFKLAPGKRVVFAFAYHFLEISPSSAEAIFFKYLIVGRQKEFTSTESSAHVLLSGYLFRLGQYLIGYPTFPTL